MAISSVKCGAPYRAGVNSVARILIIEDNPVNMRLALFLLEKQGHHVLQASDAEQGLRFAHEHSPDLILMDVQLPGMDGLAATRLLKNNVVTQSIKVIALTAFAMRGDEEKIRAAGCDGYLAKPIRYQEFLAMVGQMLAG